MFFSWKEMNTMTLQQQRRTFDDIMILLVSATILPQSRSIVTQLIQK